MASYCEVFARKEKKYRLSAQQYRFMLASLEGCMEADSFGKTKVTSLYYDTPDRRLIAHSLEKPMYKEKLRVRRYGAAKVGEAGFDGTGFDKAGFDGANFDAAGFGGAGFGGVGFGEAGSGEENSGGVGFARGGFGEANFDEENYERVFIEIKKKYKGIVYKRRVACSVAAARAYLSGVLPYEQACKAHPLADERAAAESVSPRSIQISHEIDRFLTRYETLVPSMTIACSRVAYVPASAAGAGVIGAGAHDAGAADVNASAAGAHPAGARVASAGAGAAVECADADLRITFDTDLSYRDELRDNLRTNSQADSFAHQSTSLLAGRLATGGLATGRLAAAGRSTKAGNCEALRPLLSPGEAIMEIKASTSMPMWLSHALSKCKAYPSSFSKYGAAYCKSIAEERVMNRA